MMASRISGLRATRVISGITLLVMVILLGVVIVSIARSGAESSPPIPIRSSPTDR